MCSRPSKQGGYVLLLVSLALLMIATATLTLFEGESGALAQQRSQHDRFALEAGLAAGVAHNLAALRERTSCTGYSATTGSLGDVSYTASLDTSSSSPVTLVVTANHSNAGVLSRTLSVPMYSSVDTLTLESIADAELDERRDDDNYGDADFLHAQISITDNDERALFQFDLSGLPVGSLVANAELRLWLEVNAGATDLPDSVYRMRQAWDEDEVTWNRASNGLLDFWIIPGGTRESVPFVVFADSALGQQTVDLTQLVRLWHQGAPNYGLMLSADPDAGIKHFHYASRESADPAARPQLLVDYRCDCALGCA